MPTQLKYSTSVGKNTDVALIVRAAQLDKLQELSLEETAYIKQQQAKDVKIIDINRLTHQVFIVIAHQMRKQKMRPMKHCVRLVMHYLKK